MIKFQCIFIYSKNKNYEYHQYNMILKQEAMHSESRLSKVVHIYVLSIINVHLCGIF